ncbi:MAG: hypothetical protein M3T56_09415 [Chloroflexota bacterium]|nr:hypothetical protein [Chloroflexota bacterium]
MTWRETGPIQDDFVKVFAPLERTQTRFSELSIGGPTRGSSAARDGRTKVGKIAWDTALVAGSIGVDHLVAWRMLRLRGAFQPNFAHLALIRGAIEGSSVARWLCDPDIQTTERLRRAAGAKLNDLTERGKFERRMSSRLAKPTGKGRTAEQRIVAFERLLRRRNIEPKQMPRATELFARYFPGKTAEGSEGFYRMISAVIHAKVWSVIRTQ